MSITVTCVCGQSFAARPEYAGQTLACPVCNRPLQVPADDDFLLASLPEVSAPVSKSLAPVPIRAARSGGSSVNAPLLILLVGGGMMALLVVGVVGGYLFYLLSQVRTAASLPTTVAELRDLTGEPAGDLTRDAEKVFGGPDIPMKGESVGGLQSFLPPVTPLGMVTHTRTGVFSIAAPPEFVWEDVPPRVDEVTIFHSTGKIPEQRLGDIIMVHLEEHPNASQSRRRAYVEIQKSHILLYNQLHPVSNIQGLDLQGEMPNVVNFSYDFENGSDFGKGAGRIIFSTKRVSLLSLRVFDRKDIPRMETIINSFREL